MRVLSVFLILACSTNVLSLKHLQLNSSELTWQSARDTCNRHGLDLCYHRQMCHFEQPVIIEPNREDSWVPIRDSPNDWAQIGDRRLCYKHNENYGAPAWRRQTGPYGQWATSTNDWPHKKHVFCC